MRRIVAILLPTLTALILLSLPALAATPEEAVAGLSDGLFVEGGTEYVDADRIRASIERAAAGGLTLTVVVLADPATETITFAAEVNDLEPGTVLAFTTAEYGASSDELSQGALDSTIAAADDVLSGPVIADGVDAFVDAALTEQSSTNWGLILAGIAAVLLVVGIGGRYLERRATAGRRDKALQRDWAQLQIRADGLSDAILELSTKVELDGRPELTSSFRAASNRYGDIQAQLGHTPSEESARAIESDLDDLDREVDAVRQQLVVPG